MGRGKAWGGEGNGKGWGGDGGGRSGRGNGRGGSGKSVFVHNCFDVMITWSNRINLDRFELLMFCTYNYKISFDISSVFLA